MCISSRHRFGWSLALVVAACPCVWAAGKAKTARFTPDSYAEHVRYLAGDELEGRGAGSAGLEKAAHYIAEKFASCGLKPGGEDGTFFQSFEVTVGKRVSERCALKRMPDGPPFQLNEDFVAMPFSSPGRFDGPVAFIGYGITADEYDYDDYAGFDAKGKVLLMLRYEPKSKSETDFEGDSTHSDHALFSTKAKLARKHGAAAVLIVNPPTGHTEEDRLYALERGGMRADYRIPFMHVTRKVAGQFLEAGGLPELAKLQAALDEERKIQTRDLKTVRVSGDSGVVKEAARVKNVIGILPGVGDKADEYVVIGAHYDHLGRTTLQFPDAKSNADPDAEYIHYGADDNASGTAALIALARGLQDSSSSSRRSVMLIAFAAEEIGLLGSEHYVAHPTVPLDRIVAMFNMDMIGRMKDDKLTVSGIKTSPGFEEMVKRLAEAGGFDLSTGASGFGPSDHTSFYAKKIPVLHFFSGLHLDYHKPSDSAEKINAAGAVRIAEMVASVADEVARAEQRPDYQPTKMTDRGKPRSGLKVRMGIMPSYADDDEEGMAVSGVIEDGPADKAGMLDGDAILWIGATKVDNIYDYMDGLGDFKPEDVVVVKVRRAGEIVSLRVILEGSSR